MEPSVDLRRYDSTTARLIEAARAVAWDATSVGVWAGLIIDRHELGGPKDDKPPSPYPSQPDPQTVWGYTNAALWRSAVVTLFAHYKQAPRAEIRQLYEDAMSALPSGLDIVDAFERWERVRDKAITHPVGYEAAHSVMIRWDDGAAVVDEIVSIGVLDAVTEDAVKLRAFAWALRSEAKTLEEVLVPTLEGEVAALSEEQFRGLPAGDWQAYRYRHRRFGA